MKQNLTTPIATGSTTGAHVLSFVDYIQLRRDLLIGVHSVNKRFGAHLTEEDCEDIVQNLLEFFVEKCQQGIYDSNISTPIEYLMGNKRVWGPVQKLVKIKLSQKQLPAASVDDMDDECGCTVILTGDFFGIQPDIFRGETENALLEIILNESSDRDRRVIQHLIAGTPRREIEKELQISQGALNKLIFDVRKRIRRQMEARGYRDLIA